MTESLSLPRISLAAIRVIDQMHDETMQTIENRLIEIQEMVKDRKDNRPLMERITTDQADLIKKYSNMPLDDLLQNRRKTWKRKIDRFKSAASIIILLVRGFKHRKLLYFVDQEEQLKMMNRLKSANRTRSAKYRRRNFTGFEKSSVGHALRTFLTTLPVHRDEKMIKQILWLLNAMKAFKHLFPAEMEVEVAKHVEYASYDDGRLIACQGRSPEWFLYVLAGKVSLIRQFKLVSGDVSKVMGHLCKGQTTSPDELNLGWTREENLVAKGRVELLILHKDIFQFLQHTSVGPPIDFLRSIEFLRKFPFEQFLQNSEAFQYKHYGEGKLIIANAATSPWICIVTSGHVKVVRYQSIIDTKHFRDRPVVKQKAARDKDQLIQEFLYQSNHKEKKLILPQIAPKYFGRSESNKKRHSSIEPPVGLKRLSSVEPVGPEYSSNRRKGVFKHPMMDQNLNANSPDTEDDISLQMDNARLKLLRPISESNEPPDQQQNEFSNLTHHFQSNNHLNMLQERDQNVHRKHAFLQLDWLSTGDVFLSQAADSEFQTPGPTTTKSRRPNVTVFAYLEQAAPIFLPIIVAADHEWKTVEYTVLYKVTEHSSAHQSGEPNGVSLLSDGAEVVLINKRCYLQNCDDFDKYALNSLSKEYISEEKAEELIYNQKAWQKYKTTVYQEFASNSNQ